MTPWLDDGDVRLFHGDALDVLRGLPDGSVHMCATSPPFWSLRDYQAEGQIGLEPTVDEWVARLVAVFDEVWRVLRDDATLWIECGDSFSDKQLVGQPWRLAFALQRAGWFLRSEIIWARLHPNPMPESVTDRPTKSHSTVFLLSKRPTYFWDQDAIREAWADSRNGTSGATRSKYEHPGAMRQDGGVTSQPKNSPGPEKYVPQAETLDVLYECEDCGIVEAVGNLTSGCPRCGETMVPLSGEAPRGPDGRRTTTVKGTDASEQHRDGERWPNPSGANARSVWTIPTEPTPFAHFATWPRKLVARMIQAGTSERGACPECGAPWARETSASYDTEGRTTNGPRSVERRHESPGRDVRMLKTTSTLGWSPSCTCDINPLGGSAQLVRKPVPCTVLDPFAGSGTTCLVARHHGRHAIGIELNEEYLRMAAGRLAQLSLLTEPAA